MLSLLVLLDHSFNLRIQIVWEKYFGCYTVFWSKPEYLVVSDSGLCFAIVSLS